MSASLLTRPETISKWQKVLESKDAPKIPNRYVKETIAQLLENTQRDMRVANAFESGFHAARPINEATPTSVTGNVAKWDPVLISMVRRITPQLMANDLVGVQPMTMPTGLIFAWRARYNNANGPEAFINEPNTNFTGAQTDAGGDVEIDPFASPYTTGRGMATATGEGDITAEMTYTIEKTSVEAKTRQLKSTYSVELAQDLMATHQADADAEFVAMLQEELTQEMNRELTRTIYIVAKPGAQNASTAGTYDLAVDADGRWWAEKVKGLIFQIGLEAQKVFFESRRGRGNKIIASAEVCQALADVGYLDVQSGMTQTKGDLEVDPAKSTYVGKLNGQYDVHVDPWISATNFVIVGFKGTNPFDAGLFFAPYVPFQLLRAIDPASFQPRLAFKTRYGLVSNPFVTHSDGDPDAMRLQAGRNPYYRKFKVANLTGV